MDWLDRMNAAMDYIEENLAGQIDIRAAARRACCSEHHFTRMFSFIADMPLGEYIRRRRLAGALPLERRRHDDRRGMGAGRQGGKGVTD